MQTSFQRAALATLCLAAAAFAQTATEGSFQLVGVVSYPVSASPAAAPQTPNNLVRLWPNRNVKAALGKTAVAAPAIALSNPDPAPKDVIRADEGFTGFAGLTHLDSAVANNFIGEPPDQGLAVGNGYVFEAVNLVLAIYSKTGVLQEPKVAIPPARY